MRQYTHTENKHNLISPREILPFVKSFIPFKSLVDVGCGLGTFLKAAKEIGAEEVLGIDGSWCPRDLLFKNIDPSEFKEMNLEEEINLNKKFDIAISIEVAEHLTPERASSFVRDLTQLSDYVLFAAAIPFQGGDHHYNEQWIDYWASLFSKNGFEFKDIIRPLVWNNPKIFWWYKQNIALYVKKGVENPKVEQAKTNILTNVVHPELFMAYANPKSANSTKRYTKLLIKSLINLG